MMKRETWLNRMLLSLALQFLCFFCLQICNNVEAATRPNIIFILCDDLGYGDVQCLNPEHGKIPTPNIDQLAAEGMTFSDAHSGSAVCTPTRYGILTGRYCWRTKLQSGVVQGFAPCLIEAERPTVASFLKSLGYRTAIIGKWHLNFEYLNPESGTAYRKKDVKKPPLGAVIPDGPLTRGFDYFHGFHHARDMEAVIEGDRVITHDAVENMLPRLVEKTEDYLIARSKDAEPFFLYLPLSSPHTPIVPSPEWKGQSPLGEYADFVMQTDHVLHRIETVLLEQKLKENTLIIFTSDNGCSKAAGIKKLAEQGHLVSAQFRGSKADLWEGGHCIPFLIRWPGHIEAGSRCEQTICLNDFFATVAELLGKKTPPGSCEDSVSFLPAMNNQPINSSRAGIVHHSISGHFGYRMKNWKLLLSRGSGGWSSPREKDQDSSVPAAQLYDVLRDVGEKHNLFSAHPDVAARLLQHLEADVYSGRSTPGAESFNDHPNIKLWKSGSPKN